MMDGRNYEVFKYKGKGIKHPYIFKVKITKLANIVIYNMEVLKMKEKRKGDSIEK